jgi:hypothetical protein
MDLVQAAARVADGNPPRSARNVLFQSVYEFDSLLV